MSETAEQIRTPDATETPVPEIPPQPAATEVPQPDGVSQDEVALTAEITQLWQVHQDCQSAIKQETQQFRSLRGELGRLLHQMKGLLARPGRNGQWSGWLKEHNIARSTADRLVAKHERSLDPDPNRPIDSITEPTEAEIKTLLDKIAPKLRRVLPTPSSAYRFVELLASSLALERRATGEGLAIVKPVQKTKLVELEGEAQDDPLLPPVVAESVTDCAPAETDSESMGTPAAL